MGLLSTIGAASGRAFGLTRVGAAIRDAYFNLVTLLLPGNGTNGAQNNTFLDSSTNNFTITRNGNTTQGTFSPFSQTGWSNFFNGSTSYFYRASATPLVLSGGSFTLEAWAFCTGGSGYRTVLSKRTAGTAEYEIGIDPSGYFYYYTSTVYADTTLVPLNQWVNLTVTYDGTNLRMFQNGVLTRTVAGVSAGSGTGNLSVAVEAGTGGQNFPGYISNIRITKGGALYTSGFTPSLIPLTTTVSSGTVSLLTCQSNRFVDNSVNGYDFILISNPSIQAFSPFAPTAAYSAATVGGSGYFDGSGDYLSIADNAAFDFGSGDFTIELWAYMTGAAQQFFVSQWNSPQRAWAFLVKNSGATLSFVYSTTGSNEVQIDGSITAPVNAWAHFAVVRNGNTVKTYMNGVEIGSGSVTGVTLFNASQAIEVGRNPESTSTWNFTGYMAGLRILKGTAQYTAAFTPPTSPPTAITNTSFLLNYTNAGITDATAKNDLETVGNAQISTTQSKFGGSSMYFDGTGDYLKARLTEDLRFGTGDFTFECWVYANSLAASKAGEQTLITAGVNGFLISIWNQNVHLAQDNVADLTDWASTGVTNTTWFHLAVTRSGTSMRCFVNGTQAGSTYTNSTNYTGTSFVYLGANGSGGTAFNGYIDDMRITKGYARYTANFTAPTAALPLQ